MTGLPPGRSQRSKRPTQREGNLAITVRVAETQAVVVYKSSTWFSSDEFFFLWLPANEQKIILHLTNLDIKCTGNLIF